MCRCKHSGTSSPAPPPLKLEATSSPGLDPSSRQLPGRLRPRRQVGLEFLPSTHSPDVGEAYIYDLPSSPLMHMAAQDIDPPTVLLSLTCDFRDVHKEKRSIVRAISIHFR